MRPASAPESDGGTANGTAEADRDADEVDNTVMVAFAPCATSGSVYAEWVKVDRSRTTREECEQICEFSRVDRGLDRKKTKRKNRSPLSSTYH